MSKKQALQTRATAVELIDHVIRQRRSLDLELAGHAALQRMDVRDRAFVRNLVATTLRRLGQIDALIDACLARPLPRRAEMVRNFLRIGVCQLFFTEVAGHAAVSTAVELAKAAGHTAHVKLVNAVLRRLSREGAGLVADQDAARLNTPTWLWDSWLRAYGPETCRQIATAHLSEAPLDISVSGEPAHWADVLQADVLPSGTLRRKAGGDVSAMPGFAAGQWWVQDTAARMVAGLLGDVRGKRIIDLCAAPGGKTAYLASHGAQVTAVDRSGARLGRLRENLERLSLRAEIVTADATQWRPPELADAVLLDAPCSATGTIRRHPDIIWNKSDADVQSLAAAQLRLLAAAAEMVKPGGTLVFATCSLQPEEGHQQIDAVLSSGAALSLDLIEIEEAPGLAEVIDDQGMFRSLPCHLPNDGGMDGFFAARFFKL